MLLIIHPLYLILQWDAERGSKSITIESKEWIEQHIPSGSKILLDNAGNAGPKLANAPDNVKRQYERARAHGLLKAEFLKLQLEIEPPVYYDIVEIDTSAGSRSDDYMRYRLWQDTDVMGQPPLYYCEKGYNYIIVTNRYFPLIEAGFIMIKEFTRGREGNQDLSGQLRAVKKGKLCAGSAVPCTVTRNEQLMKMCCGRCHPCSVTGGLMIQAYT